MLNLRERRALVIGGDGIAAEKATALAAAGARVTVMSASFCEALPSLAARRDLSVALWQKEYAPGDLAGYFVVVAATTSEPELTEAIWREAREHNTLLNVVDVPARCDFIVPSILRRGQLTLAVSTEGASPALAKRVRQQLEGVFSAAYAPYLRLAAAARTYLRQSGVSYGQRDNFFGAFFASDALARIEAGDTAGAAASTAALLRTYAITVPAHALEEAMAADGDS